MSKQELVAKAQFAAALGGKVEIAGMWVWVSFANKPDAETREQLKAEKFRWGRKKKKWYFAGVPARNKRSMDWSYIVQKYGVYQFADDSGKAVA